jgi:hypothetical protein
MTVFKDIPFREMVEKACAMAHGRSATVGSLAEAIGVPKLSFYKYHSGHRAVPGRVTRAVQRILDGKDILVETKKMRRSQFGPAKTHHAIVATGGEDE